MHSLDTLFLDRDGVVNVKLEARYVRNSNEFEFMQGALVAISKLSKLFKRILIVTNQQAIGKGIMTEDDLNLLHSFMTSEIGKLNGKIE